ncbi:MAG: translation initiation factor 2 [Syntrophomonadaceae bacterium]|nr:translation initiation factor 2 [Syntrophomonadaceae bacterium]
MESERYKLLLNRVKELEKKVEQLRISRRVLMNLVAQLEKEKADQVLPLIEENRRLKKANNRYAQILWSKNQQIAELTFWDKPEVKS